MHFLYTDQNNTFNCQVEIEGADSSKSSTRLIIETSGGVNLLYEGTLSSQGECNIPLDNVKKFLKENESGKLKLEVIVEDSIFTPWESNYFVKASKKVKVTEVKSNESLSNASSPKINVKVTSPKSDDVVSYHITQLNKLLESVDGKTSNKDLTKIFEFYKKKKMSNDDSNLITEVKNKFLK